MRRSQVWRIPDTLITNDPGRARDFVKRHDGDVIHKTLTDPSSHLLDTRMWDASTDDGYLDDSLPLAPVIFQSRIRGGDVRSVLIGSEIFSVIIDSEGSRSVIDSRLDLDATYRPYEVAAPAVAQLHDLMARLGLVFGVADFKIDHDGNLVFLEINPQGQFLFMENPHAPAHLRRPGALPDDGRPSDLRKAADWLSKRRLQQRAFFRRR